MEINKKSVGKRIQSVRKKLGLTLEEFGLLVENAQKSNVSKWERGSSIPSNSRLKKIAELGSVSTDWLLYGSPIEGMINELKKLYSEQNEDAKKLLIEIAQKDLSFSQSTYVLAALSIIQYVEAGSGLYETLPELLIALADFDTQFPEKIDHIVNKYNCFETDSYNDKQRVALATEIINVVNKHVQNSEPSCE